MGGPDGWKRKNPGSTERARSPRGNPGTVDHFNKEYCSSDLDPDATARKKKGSG